MYQEPEVNLDGLIPGNSGMGRKIVNHKMKEGDNVFRILPPFGTNHNGLLYAEVTLHWFLDPSGKSRPLVCSRDKEKYCPICAEAFEFYNRKQELVKKFSDDSGKVNWKALPKEVNEQYQELNEVYNKLRGQKGFYYNALDLSGTVGVLRLSKTTAEKLGKKIKEAQQMYSIKCTSLSDGILFNIKKTKTGSRDFDVTYDVEYLMTPKKREDGSISLEFNRGSVSDSIMQNFENLAYDIHAMYPVRTSTELKRVLDGDKSVWAEMDARRNAVVSNGNGNGNVAKDASVVAAFQAPTYSSYPEHPKYPTVTLVSPSMVPSVSVVSTPNIAVPTTNSDEEESIRRLKAELGID